MNCKTCKHWERTVAENDQEVEAPTTVGKCAKAIGVAYYDDLYDLPENQIKGFFGGENIYTHEDFGCVHYEQPAQDNEIDGEFDAKDMQRAVESFKSDIKAIMAKYGFAIRSRTSYAGSDETPYQIDELEIKGLLWNAETFHEIITDAFGVICLPEQ